MRLMLSNIQVKDGILEDEKYKYLFSVEAVNELVNKGVPFREAYKQVGNQIDKGEFHFDYRQQLHHTHDGSIGNLSNDQIAAEMEKVLEKFRVNCTGQATADEKLYIFMSSCLRASPWLSTPTPLTAASCRRSDGYYLKSQAAAICNRITTNIKR